MKISIPKPQLFAALMLLASVSTFAYDYDFESDGIWYTILSEPYKTAEVSYYTIRIQNDLIIPDKVAHPANPSKIYSITNIRKHAFSNCGRFNSVTIPNSITTIGGFAFNNCYNLASVTIGNSVISIEEYTFSSCRALTSIKIPNSVTAIGKGAFESCDHLASVTIGNSVASIGDAAFDFCKALTSIKIPNSVTFIGTGAFRACYNLTTVYCEAITPPNTGKFTFDKSNTLKGTLYVPIGCKQAYRAVEPWRNFYNIEEIDFASVTTPTADHNSTMKIAIDNGTIIVSGISESDYITIYDTKGQIVYNGTNHTIKNLPHGMYIIKTDTSTAKVSL